MPEDEPNTEQGRAKRKKRAPAHFKPGGAALVQNLIADADSVADRSFLGRGGSSPAGASRPSAPPAPVETVVREEVPAPAVPVGADEGSTPTASVPASHRSPEALTSAASPVSAQSAEIAAGKSVGPSVSAESERETGDSSKSRTLQEGPAFSAPLAEQKTRPTGEPDEAPSSAETRSASASEVADVDVVDDKTPSPARGRRPRHTWAHRAIHESFADAKLRSTRWKSHGFRIAPEVLGRLKERLNSDRRSTGNSALALGHYVDAALRNLPGTVSEQIEMAAAFEANQLWDQERTQPSNYRVGETAYELMSNLKLALQEADFGRRGTHVVSAGIERLLEALDAEGPLQRPERGRS